jgi:hypothetical protein
VKTAGGLLIAVMMAPVPCNVATAERAPSHITVAVADAFRADAAAAYRLIDPVCGMTLNPALLRRYEPPRARLTALVQRAMGTPFQAILADVKRGQETLASEVDCARPAEDPGTAGRIARDLAAAGQALSRMERAVSSYMSGKH